MKEKIVTIILISLLTIFLTMGCATQTSLSVLSPMFNKEAIQKGYWYFDKKEATINGILTLAIGSPPASMGWKWNDPLMEQNYPECFFDNAGNKSPWIYSSRECVRNRVKEEGFWR